MSDFIIDQVQKRIMEQLQSVDCEISKISLKNEAGGESPPGPLSLPPQPNLSLDHNPHSFGLSIQHSIERGIPIPRNMLSHSDDAPLDDNDDNKSESPPIKLEPTDEDKRWLQDELGLKEVLMVRRGPTNTKNVLRNFGNAQNQYILYHQHALTYVTERAAHPEKFFRWVRTIRLEKFENFKEVWSSEATNPVFRRLYRQLCFRFYRDCAIPYVLSSRMKNEATKLSHLRFIYRFVQGLKDPYTFTYFKKNDR